MPARRGIKLLDLLPNAPGGALIPSDFAEQLGVLAVLDYQTVTTDTAFIYHGSIQSVADMGLPSLRNWPVQAPGLNTGLPFQLTVIRTAPTGGQNLEPAGQDFRLDLFLDKVAITIPGLRPAKFVAGSGVTAAHLVPDTSRQNVQIVGGGVLRIDSTGGNLNVRFVDQPDPFDPNAPTGPVFTLGFDPPHFFIGGMDLGLTVDRLTYDDSPTYTPADIEARGHGPDWRGISIKEATLYLPRNAPVVGDLSIGVHDVLLGSPFGLQGEIQIELGKTPVDPSMINFFQEGATSALATSGTAPDMQVTLPAGTSVHFRVRGAMSGGGTARWALPDGTREDAAATALFDVVPGNTVRVSTLETVSGQTNVSPAVNFQFRETSAANPPQINVSDGSHTWTNVVHLSGKPTELRNLTFATSPSRADARWQLGSGAGAETAQGATFAPTIPSDAGTHTLLLTDANNRTRRLEIEVLADGGLLVGCQSGVADRSGPVTVRDVTDTWDLQSFHMSGDRRTANQAATVSGGTVTVPGGTLARVTVERGQPGAPDSPATPPAPPEPKRRVQILMDFDSDTVLSWGEDPYRLDGPCTAATLQTWAAKFSGATFYVVGRTDELGLPGYDNHGLGVRRAAKAREMLGTAAATVSSRSEQDAPTASELAAAATVPWSDFGQAQWAIKTEHPEYTSWSNPPRDNGIREQYRRADIYVVGGTVAGDTPTNPNDNNTRAPELRRVLVPGADTGTNAITPTQEPKTPYRVRLRVVWDSPTVADLADAIPTMAELLVAWEPHPVSLPGTGQNVTPQGPAVYTVIVRWSYDPRSGETVVSVSLDSGGDPDGIFHISNDLLATAMGLGPALIAFMDAAGIDGAAVRIAGLLGASAVASAWAKNGKVIVHGIQIEHKQKALDSLAGVRERLMLDYSVELGFAINTGPIQINAQKPMKVRHKNVGAEFDDSRSGLDKLGLVYDDAHFEIEDPGQWQINGPLGDLLRVVATRGGAGSSWLEVDLAFALDLGVIRVSGATIRVTFKDGGVGVELRGLAASVKIPGTLEGSGNLSVGDGGTISAGLALTIIPAKIAVSGWLDLNPAVGFVAIGVQCIFAVGLPLASTGLGIFGFAGLFAANGARNLLANPDPIQQEIDWYRKASGKFKPQKGQWALGLGALVGTLPDSAFTFNAMGMFVVCFPDPTVVFGIDAHVISQPSPASDTDSSSGGSFELLGMIVVDPTAFKLGIRGSYEIPKLLRLLVPISAYFPFDRTKAAYFRIGSDGQVAEGRPGDPVTILLLPGTLDVNVWAFFMVEEKQLHKLGGEPLFSFDGFSIGFGAGWGIDWSAGPLKLSASAKILVGLGTRPLLVVGGIWVRGELSLVVIDISVSGNLILKLTPASTYLTGQFCGSVDLFFFSIEGCVGIEIGSEFDPTIPDAPTPLLGVDLTERFGRVTGKASATDGGNTVWPDTVPVLQFKQYLLSDLSSAFHPVPSNGIPGPAWSGTSELKYAYKLTGLALRKVGGADMAGPLDAVWWLPTHRNGVSDPSGPTPQEIAAGQSDGRQLALLAWHPAPWARNLTDGGAGTPADPATTVGRLCDPTLVPVSSCVLGRTAVREGVSQVQMTQETYGTFPFPSNFVLHGTESYGPWDLATLSSMTAEKGLQVIPGGVRPLPLPFVEPGHPAIDKVYELAALGYQGKPAATVQFTGDVGPALWDGALTLAVCPTGRQPVQREVCHNYAGLPAGVQKLPLTVGTCTYQPLDPRFGLRVVNWLPNLTPQLQFPAKGVKITMPVAADSVSVQAVTFGQPVRITAYNAAGTALSSATSPSVQKQAFTLSVAGPGIQYVVVDGGANEAALVQFCYKVTVAAGELPLPEEAQQLLKPVERQRPFPQVFGVLPGGKRVEWKPELIKQPNEKQTCRFVRYHAPETGAWEQVVVLPFFGARVGVVELCGVTWEAQLAYQDDQAAKNDLKDAINNHTASDAPEGNRPLLDANADYEVAVTYRWVGWRKTDAQKTPPDVSSVDWNANPERTEVYRFHTAPAAAPAETPPDYYDEHEFDVRALQRYILGFEPDGKGAPHFLDDPIKVHFAVDYPKQLLGKYGRGLELKLRRTNPKAGSMAGKTGLPDLSVLVGWGKLGKLEYMPLSDRRIIDAAKAAPCVNEPDLGGSTATITAPLEPDAEYDLLVVAPSLSDPKDELLIARCHFRTSHYQNPAAMLAALGLTTPANPALPHDFLITGAGTVPAASLPAADLDLQQALTDIGMEPWPLPETARTVTIWKNQSGWKLAGLLVEISEPLERTGRLHVTGADVGAQTLTPVRLNAAGSRILLAPAAPITVGPADRLTLRLQDQDGSVLSGQRFLAGGPRVLYQEGL